MGDIERKITTLANQAAERYIAGRVPLSQSVAELAKKHNLTRAETQRLIEATNRITFLKLYQQAPANAKVINFDLAKPEEVFGDFEKKKAIEAAVKYVKKSRASEINSADMLISAIKKRSSMQSNLDKQANYQPKHVLQSSDEFSRIRNIGKEHREAIIEFEQLRKEATVAQRKFDLAKKAFTETAIDVLHDYSIDEVIKGLSSIDSSGLKYLKDAFEHAKGAGILKRAYKAPEYLILNGDHPLVKNYIALLEAEQICKEAQQKFENAHKRVESTRLMLSLEARR